jgi:hypothetical protein
MNQVPENCLSVTKYSRKLSGQCNVTAQIEQAQDKKPEALKSLYRSPGYKKNQLVLCKNYVLQW